LKGTGILTCFPFGVLRLRYVLGPTDPRLTNIAEAASQGGIEIGFHSQEAIDIAAQTARGAATLILTHANHPEYEIDRVTTPRGCTIAGLNQMEHEGFSSAMIKGITVSAEHAKSLYKNTNNSD